MRSALVVLTGFAVASCPSHAQNLPGGSRRANSPVPLSEFESINEYAEWVDEVCRSTPLTAEKLLVFGRSGLGQHYRLNAPKFSLEYADCVSWLQRTLSVSAAGSWAEARKVYTRLAYKDGVNDILHLNYYTLAEWLPNNAWLLDDITTDLGPTETLKEQINWRHSRERLLIDRGVSPRSIDLSAFEPGWRVHSTPYLPRSSCAGLGARLQTGDIVFVITRPPEQAPTCTHMGLASVGGNVFHCAYLKARDEPLDQMLDRFEAIGVKVARLKELTSQQRSAQLSGVVQAPTEIAGAPLVPEQTLEVDGVQYGAINYPLGRTMYSLFGSRWKAVYELGANSTFRRANPNPHRVIEGGILYFPLNY